jgi:hypothetical protein
VTEHKTRPAAIEVDGALGKRAESGARKRYASAIINLARSRQVVIRASSAFNLVGAAGFLWFQKRPVAAIDDNHVRAEFVEWLKDASDEEIDGFISDMGLYRRELKREVESDPVPMGPTERGAILRGDSGRIAWRKIHKLAGAAAAPLKRMKEARSAIDWQSVQLKIDERRKALRPLVIDLVAKHPDEKPSGIATLLRRKPEFKALRLTFGRRTIETDVGEIMKNLATTD